MMVKLEDSIYFYRINYPSIIFLYNLGQFKMVRLATPIFHVFRILIRHTRNKIIVIRKWA